MRNLYRIAIIFAVALISIYCGGGKGSGNPGLTTDQKIEIQLDSKGGIYAIFYKNINILGKTNGYKGAYYIIGSCPQDGVGIDDFNNVHSQSQDFGELLNTGDEIQTAGRLQGGSNFCKGADYEFIFSRPEENRIVVYIGVSQLPEEYSSLSIPMDFKKHLFNRFSFGETESYEKTGPSCTEADYETVNSNKGFYDDLFPYCYIPGGGATGVARTNAPWVEACSDELGICVKRTIIEISQYGGTFANNHHGTNNTEFSWGNFIPPGTSFYIREEILIYKF